MFCNEVRVAVCKVICVCNVREFKGLERKQFYLSTSMSIFVKYNIKKIPVLKYLHICVII